MKRWWCGIGLMLAAVAGAETLVSDGVSLMESQGRWTQWRTGNGAVYDFTGYAGVYAAEIREAGGGGAAGGTTIADPRRPASEQVFGQMVSDPSFEYGGRGWNIGSHWSLDESVSHSGKGSLKVSLPDTPTISGNVEIVLDVQPNTTYAIEAWIRSAGNGMPFYYLVQLDENGEGRPEYPQICVSQKPSPEWQCYSYELTTAPFCRKLRLYFNAWEQTGDAWIDDVSVVASSDDYMPLQQPIAGKLEFPAPGVARETATVDDIVWTTTYRAGENRIDVKVEAQDLTGRDRAVSMSFRLPYREPANACYLGDFASAPQLGERQANVRRYGDRRVVNLYPFSAVAHPDDGTLLGIGVPLDQPRVFHTGYRRGMGFFICYEFALSQATSRFPGRAEVEFSIYGEKGGDFRAALQGYYDRFPQFFERRLVTDGTAAFTRGEHSNSWGAEVKTLTDPRYYVPSLAIWNSAVRPEELAANRRELIRNFAYTETSGWWGWALGFDAEQAKAFRPSPAEVLPLMEKLAAEHPDAGVRERAQSVINSGMETADGLPMLGAYIPEYCGYHYECNPDWELPGVTRYSITRAEEIQPVFDLGLDGVYFDCIFAGSMDNFREEHFRYTIAPLGFDHVTRRPVLPLGFSVFKCVRQVAEEMRETGRYVISNFSVTDSPVDMFCIPFIDVVGNEMLKTFPSLEKMRLLRVLAGTKPVSLCWMEAKNFWPREKVEAELLRAMSFGFFYHQDLLPRDLVRKYTPVTRRLSAAGWRPLPEANVESASPVGVERFGSLTNGDLHYTVYNDRDETVQFRLTLPELPEGSAVYRVPDAFGFERLSHPVELTLQPKELAVITVATPERLRRDLLADVPGFLQRAANYLAEIPELEEVPDFGMLREAVAAMTAGEMAAEDYAGVRRSLEPLRCEGLTETGRAYLDRANEYLEWAALQVEAVRNMADVGK